jgi:rhodanese-related sulfurtransferase|tara:strand:+ start:464 stop:790 length:327 start_codon:yes stop_codon:yes gene_type:complete
MTQVVTAIEAFALIEDGKAILIDVREANEFKSEHIADALSAPLSSLEDELKMLDIPKDKTILFQCLKGARGQMACERTQGLGLYPNNIINLEGGIQAWKESGLPVIGS